jgi:hypothetical protein
MLPIVINPQVSLSSLDWTPLPPHSRNNTFIHQLGFIPDMDFSIRLFFIFDNQLTVPRIFSTKFERGEAASLEVTSVYDRDMFVVCKAKLTMQWFSIKTDDKRRCHCLFPG